MRVHLGSDHAGLELKQRFVRWLSEHDHQPFDHGPYAYDPDDDYPAYCIRAAEGVVADPGSVGVVIGGSGNGEQIAANKVHGVRAALVWSAETAELCRLHNDANVMGIGARQHTVDEAISFLEVYVSTSFSGQDRHARRIGLVADYEREGAVTAPLDADRVDDTDGTDGIGGTDGSDRIGGRAGSGGRAGTDRPDRARHVDRPDAG